MVNIILYLVGVIGLSHILVDGSIFELPREYVKRIFPNTLGKLISCYACTGFWCGLFTGWACLSDDPWLIFVAGCGGSFLSMWGAVYLNVLEAKMIVTYKKEDDSER